MRDCVWWGIWFCGLVTMICSFIINESYLGGIASGLFISLIIQSAMEGSD